MRKLILLAGAAAGVLVAPSLAAAQDKNETTGLAEIVVTATKRSANLQSVPVAVTAITGETIQNQRINEFGDLTRAAASLTLTQSTASPNNAIILRGIGTYAFSIGVEPSVAVIIDDVPVVQQAQAFDNLSDVERIEVLRGPQGTLFGKNASAGAINIVTRDPSVVFSGHASATVTTDRGYKADGSISGPISDATGYRLGVYYNHWDGNVRNLANGHRLNDNTSYGVRGKLRSELTDKLVLSLNGSYAKSKSDGTAATLRSIDLNYIPAGATTAVIPRYNGVSILPALAGIKPGADNRKTRVDNDGFTENKQASFSGKLTYDLGFASLISVTSYQDWKYNFSADVDGTDLAVNGTAPNVTSPIAPGVGVSNSGPYHSTSFTQEVRLTSKGEGPLSYVLGAFYADAKTTRDFQRGPALILAKWTGWQSTRSVAAFAGVDYKFPTNTTISGAVRVNNERIEDSFVNLLSTATVYVSPTNIGTCGAGSQLCAGSNEDTATTWKLSVNQELAPRISVYASAATGYKGYAYDISSGYTPLRTQNPVQPEKSKSYETGLKSRFLDNRLQLNVAAFYTDYDNFQAQSSQYINGALQQKLNNVGKLRTKGVEVEAQAMPVEWLRLDASAAYTDAKVVSFPNAACYPGQAQTGVGCAPSTNPVGLGNVQDRSNTQLPNSPKMKINLGGTVTRDLTSDLKGVFTVNYQYQSKVNFDLLGNPLAEQKAYGLVNASASIERGDVKATVFVNNLFNEHFVTGIGDGFGSYGVHYVTQVLSRDSDRYFGFKVDTKF
ncbi:TonB-dependent receptor [Caulobacter segnis]|uniref:TonB-dependent receptor n=2 Tax=Caulobacter segnis TaxID=88688 RepID=D5VMK1_CAUST|nr:TonB-dependent receptor [Caulobacter segnis]ADG11724.1 TonB-dependent receptor [Caulobacter segnis ATCC 21756]AVQ03365.1 TonB-dependent receptor [Caulobacter segnis]